MRAQRFLFALILSAVCGTVIAHGPQIQVTLDNNKITTRRVLIDDYTSAGITSPISVYVMPVNYLTYLGQAVARIHPDASQLFGPGLAYGLDQLDGGDRVFTAPFNLHFGGLEIWNGASFVPTGAEQLGLLQSSSNVNPDSVKTAAAGADLAVAVSPTYNAGAHSSIRYTLLGDGLDPFSTSRYGVYRVALQLSGTQSPSITPSDPFYFVLEFGASDEAVAAAVNSLGIAPELVQYAPEPSAALLAICGFTFGTTIRGTRRRCSQR